MKPRVIRSARGFQYQISGRGEFAEAQNYLRIRGAYRFPKPVDGAKNRSRGERTGYEVPFELQNINMIAGSISRHYYLTAALLMAAFISTVLQIGMSSFLSQETLERTTAAFPSALYFAVHYSHH